MKNSNLFLVLMAATLLIITSCATVPKTPLIDASTKGDSLTAEKLIKEGANINEPDKKHGATPLMHAIWAGKTAVAKRLIEYGADIKVKDKTGCDALNHAAYYKQIEIVNALLDRGADIETRDSTETTPLNYAIAVSDYAIVELLLNRGANIESREWMGATPLVNAVKCSANIKIVQLLIKKGANLNAKDKEGYTPLAWALYYQKTDVATEIKKAIADARKDMPTAKVVLFRDSYFLTTIGREVVVYINDEIVANLDRTGTDYMIVSPGTCTISIKGKMAEGDHARTFDAKAGETYYFEVSRRAGNVVAGMGGLVGQFVESRIRGDDAGPFAITPVEENIAKDKIQAILKK